MEILYIIGNGFDINLGMKTRYSDFYTYYKTTNSKSEAIQKMKESISNNIENWSDLELAFGRYTSKLKNLEEFDEVYDDLIDNLCDYLINEEQNFDFSKVSPQILYDYLCYPEKSLPQEDIEEISSLKKAWINEKWNIHIVSFNYTRSIEKIVKTLPIVISRNSVSSINLQRIYHIHGYTDKDPILGVNDISQIENIEFHANENIIEALVKTKCNRALRHNVDKLFEKYISEAHLICIFGSSLGDTDNYWWELIGNSIKKGTHLIIFKKGEKIKQRFGHKKIRSRKAILNLFLEKLNLTNEEKEKAQKFIHIDVNTDMFNFRI
jgi:hypothetical protein